MRGSIIKIFDNSSVKDFIEVLVQPAKGGMKIVRIRQGDLINISHHKKPKTRGKGPKKPLTL